MRILRSTGAATRKNKVGVWVMVRGVCEWVVKCPSNGRRNVGNAVVILNRAVCDGGREEVNR